MKIIAKIKEIIKGKPLDYTNYHLFGEVNTLSFEDIGSEIYVSWSDYFHETNGYILHWEDYDSSYYKIDKLNNIGRVYKIITYEK